MNAAGQEAAIRTRWRSGAGYFVLHSSGSTGAPAAYSLPRRLLEWSAKQTAAALEVQPSDSMYCCLPLDRAGGFMQVIRSEQWNIPLLVVEPNGHPMRNLDETHPFSITSLSNSQLASSLLSDEEAARLRRFRAVLVGGEALSPATEQEAMQQGIRLWHTYGMTETASHIALRRAGTEHFIPFDGVALHSDPEDGHLVIDIPGILETVLHTRDRAVIDEDGNFSISGRLDEIINSGGIKIQAEAVERLLEESGSLRGRSFVITSKAHPIWGRAVVLVVEGAPLPLKLQTLKGIIAPHIAYGYPKEIIYMEFLPRTETGKIRRAAIRMLVENKH